MIRSINKREMEGRLVTKRPMRQIMNLRETEKAEMTVVPGWFKNGDQVFLTMRGSSFPLFCGIGGALSMERIWYSFPGLVRERRLSLH